jgi:hypothetical protein
MANIRINVGEVYEVTHWARQFGVTDRQLLDAIKEAGPLVDGVRQYLKDQVDPQRDDTLLTVNIQLPEPELVAILQKRCAEFGTVKFIRLMPIAKNAFHRFAFVQMSTLVETMDLANAAGGSTLGSGAVAMRLEAEF